MNAADLKFPNARVYALEPEHAISIDLPSGSVVRAIAGTSWLTQEGRAEDIVLGPGQAFPVTARGRIVVTALRAPAVVLSQCATAATSGASLVTPERVAAIEAQARRLRQREIARLAAQLVESVARAGRRVGRSVRWWLNMLWLRQVGAGAGLPGHHSRRRTRRRDAASAAAPIDESFMQTRPTSVNRSEVDAVHRQVRHRSFGDRVDHPEDPIQAALGSVCRWRSHQHQDGTPYD